MTDYPAGSDAAVPASRATVTPMVIRRLIDKLVPGDADFDAFCINHFPAVKRRFSAGMDRVGKVNLLLEHVELEELVERLRDEQPLLLINYLGATRAAPAAAVTTTPAADLGSRVPAEISPRHLDAATPRQPTARRRGLLIAFAVGACSLALAVLMFHIGGHQQTKTPLGFAGNDRTPRSVTPPSPAVEYRFLIKSQPTGARIIRGDTGQEVGHTPWSGLLANCAGSISLLLVLDGYIQKDVRLDCHQRPGETFQLTKIDLTP